MPNFGRTPEALLGRNDSKNPATTCKGITGSGRPCRRALATPKAYSGATLANNELYCWQHKDQAHDEPVSQPQTSGKPGRRPNRVTTDLFPLEERTSIDTLVQRLGIVAPVNGPNQNNNSNPNAYVRPRPSQHQTVQTGQAPYAEKYNRKPKPRKPGFWASLCCSMSDQDDYVEIVRHRKRVNANRPPESRPSGENNFNLGSGYPSTSVTRPGLSAQSKISTSLPVRPAQQRHDSLSGQYVSLIPSHLSPQTTSALLAELVKPISQTDEEGYIYIFWLTPQSREGPAPETARSLLTPTRPNYERRLSDVISEFSAGGSEHENYNKNTIMLKIGRANNVTRRMNEWQRQCGYSLNLVRWYPHVPSSANPSPSRSPGRQASLYPDLSRPPVHHAESDVVRKVNCVKRVERLIHLELAEKRVMRQCTACGREHREWFEVGANQASVREVDDCIRRWIKWSESQPV